MFQSGMGPSHVNTFLAALEIPGLQHTALRNRSLEVASAVQVIAETSCQEILLQESSQSEGTK
jgi:hypothetical protein